LASERILREDLETGCESGAGELVGAVGVPGMAAEPPPGESETGAVVSGREGAGAFGHAGRALGSEGWGGMGSTEALVWPFDGVGVR